MTIIAITSNSHVLLLVLHSVVNSKVVGSTSSRTLIDLIRAEDVLIGSTTNVLILRKSTRS